MTQYKTFPYKGFGGGLNLRDGPDVVAEDQAIDAMNVFFGTRGSVAQRGGFAKFTSDEGTNRYDSLAAFYKFDGSKQLLAGGGNRLDVLDTAGDLVAFSNAPTASPHYFQRFGGPTAEHIYIANGVDTVRRWTGAAFEVPVYSGFTPTGRFLGLSATDNRLAAARFPGSVAGNNPSTVRFAAEGDPLTWGNTWYTDLTPGDGEEIMGVASWNNMVIVFKQTRFFIFYGNSVDDDGDPVFNYRPVDAGVGLAAPGALAVSEQGIYFLDRTGIYFTAGGQPERVSDLVDPIFTGTPSVYYTGGTLNDSAIEEVRLVYHSNRLWFSFPTGTSAVNNRQLVFDPHEKWWSLTDLPAGPMVNFRPAFEDELVFGYTVATKSLGRYVEGRYDADYMSQTGTGGNTIESYWQGGWFNYDSPLVKTIRESTVSGSGHVVVGYARDYRQTPSITAVLELSPAELLWDSGVVWDSGDLWGPTSTVQTKPMRKSIRGESFSLRLSNSAKHRTFLIHRLTTHVREARIPSVVKT